MSAVLLNAARIGRVRAVLPALCALLVVWLGAPAAASAFPATPSGFGFQQEGAGNGEGGFNGYSLGGAGALDMQAGSHPQELSLTFELNVVRGGGGEALGSTGGELRDLRLSLPAGVVLNADAVSGCTRRAFAEEVCPGASQVGEVTLQTVSGGVPGEESSALYDLVAPGTAPAELGFSTGGAHVLAYESLRTGVPSAGEEGFDLDVLDLPQRPGTQIVGGRFVLFGAAGGAPFLTLPTACGGPLPFAVSADTWEQEGEFAEASFLSHEPPAAGGALAGIQGCGSLALAPQVAVSTETSDADTATGLTVNVKTPPEGLLAGGGLSPADIQAATVQLPEGLVFNPVRAEGLVSCSPAQSGLGSESAPSCPGTSQVGTVQISTPILANTLEGGVYVLPSSPPELRLLIAGSADGVNLKLVGVAALDEATGRVTLSVPQMPPLPIEELRLSLSGGGQAALVTPRECGAYAVSTLLTPWAAPAILDSSQTTSIEVARGPEGGGCAFPPPFTPSLTAGTSIDGAGGFASLSFLLERPDGQQRLSSFSLTGPPGVLAMLASVPLCEEPQASQGSCPVASLVGHAVLGVGPGGYPLFLPGAGQGQIPIYLTGSHDGAPYGLAIAVPFLAGPYDLGTRVLRARVEVNPRTAQLTIASDPLPGILAGVPLDLRTLHATLDRPGFIFNPTNCDAFAFQGSASSAEGATISLSTPFQVGSCRSLGFTPTLTLTTSARASKSTGASLQAKISFPPSRQGNVVASGQANLRTVELALPKRLSVRGRALQQACPASVFESNPVGCPAAATVGQASASTPVLAAPLAGPVYLVAHAGEAHPALVAVLDGGGLALELTATTTTSRGITTVTFTGLPDVPLATFEVTLPQGPHSALTADGSLCKGTFSAATELTGQNGATISQADKLTVQGCPKSRAAKHRGRATSKHTRSSRHAHRRSRG